MAALVVALICLLTVSCADRPRRNPLDPRATAPLDLTDPLQALAGDGRVVLRWDFTRFDDILRVRISRETDDGASLVYERPRTDTVFVDEAVVNGTIYRYRLALDIDGQPQALPIVGEPLATPGPERGWIADRGSGLVWRLSPDGRQGVFARGRFPSISAIAVDRLHGACWVADELLSGLRRIAADGLLERVGAPLEGAEDLIIDSQARRGWVAVPGGDVGGSSVYGFDVDAATDTVQLTRVDGAFSGPLHLAPAEDGGLWIADPGDGRVLLYDGEGVRQREWRDLTGIVELQSTATPCCSAWVLVDDGDRLLRLSPAGRMREVELPFTGARALGVGGVSGEVWVAADTEVAAYDFKGGLILHWPQVTAGRGIAVDEVNEGLWLAAAGQLAKISLGESGGLTYRTRLTGFTSVLQVVVDPGR